MWAILRPKDERSIMDSGPTIWNRRPRAVSASEAVYESAPADENAPVAWILAAAILPVLLWAAINAPRNVQTLASLLAAAAVLELVAPDAVRLGRRIIGPAFCISTAAYVLFGVPLAVLVGCARGVARAVNRRNSPAISTQSVAWAILAPLFAGLAADFAAQHLPHAMSALNHAVGAVVFVGMMFALELAGAATKLTGPIGLLPPDATRGFFPWTPAQYALFGTVGFGLSGQIASGHLSVLIFLAVPFAIARASFAASGWGTERYVAALERENDALLNRTGQFDRANGDLIEALAIAIDEQDGAERGRTKRISQIATRIGSALGITGWNLEILRRAALLHDVGILAVPGGEQTALHCEFGARLVARWRDGRTIAQVIEQHHERLDGSGYPRGLKGDQIILEARIVAVAETFVNLTVGQTGMGTLDALRELENRRGLEFDPAVVDALGQAVEPRTADVLPMTRRRPSIM